MKTLKLIALAVSVVVAGTFLIPRGGTSTRYLVTGASTVAPILQRVAERLEALDPELRIEVETGGTGRGIKDSHQGTNDLGMASRTLTEEEARGLHAVPIAYDGVALIVHADNPLSEITAEQVVAIYTGALHDWSELGGPAGEITVVNKAEGRSTLEVFLHHFELEASQIQADVVIGDNAQGVRLVSGDPRAIGYVSIGDAERAVENGVPLKLLRYRDVQPSVATVSDGTYPIRRSLYLIFRGEPDPTGQRILDFLEGAEGRALVEEMSFVPLGAVGGAQ